MSELPSGILLVGAGLEELTPDQRQAIAAFAGGLTERCVEVVPVPPDAVSDIQELTNDPLHIVGSLEPFLTEKPALIKPEDIIAFADPDRDDGSARVAARRVVASLARHTIWQARPDMANNPPAWHAIVEHFDDYQRPTDRSQLPRDQQAYMAARLISDTHMPPRPSADYVVTHCRFDTASLHRFVLYTLRNQDGLPDAKGLGRPGILFLASYLDHFLGLTDTENQLSPSKP